MVYKCSFIWNAFGIFHNIIHIEYQKELVEYFFYLKKVSIIFRNAKTFSLFTNKSEILQIKKDSPDEKLTTHLMVM